MSSWRATIREKIPFSTAIYEDVDRRRRTAASKRLLPSLAARSPLKLDLGGGYRKGTNGWITIDLSHECDLYWDLRHGIPFADSSVDAVYSSHLFEHLPYPDGQRLMKEARRVLKPGGSFSIVVPNARLYVEHYMGLRQLPDEYFLWEPAFNRTTSIDALNYVAHMAGEHKYLFDLENLLHVLTTAGFDGVMPRDFDPETDLAERDYESIYAIGHKPL